MLRKGLRKESSVAPHPHPRACPDLLPPLVLYRVMRLRLKAKGHAASPRTVLDLLARIQKHTTHIGDRTFNGASKTTPEQHDLFDALSLSKPA
jgi:hypothetical protein